MDSSNHNYLNKLLIVVFSLSGMTALIYEIVWIRLPIFYMDGDDFNITYNTFHAVFPHVYIYKMETGLNQLLFVGSQKPLEIDDPSFYLIDHEKIPVIQTELNTDDKPILEFSTSVNVYNTHNQKAIIENLVSWITN